MKKIKCIFVLFWFIISISNFLFSQKVIRVGPPRRVTKLPNGEEVETKSKSTSNGKLTSVTFFEPKIFDTHLGELELIGLSFFKSSKTNEDFKNKISGMKFSKSFLMNTPLGKLKIKSVLFQKEINKNEEIKRTISGIELYESKSIDTPFGQFKSKKIRFFNDGKVRGIDLLIPKIINTPAGKFKIHGSLDIHKNGNVNNILLFEDVTINKKLFKKNDMVAWDKNSKFRGKIGERRGGS